MAFISSGVVLIKVINMTFQEYKECRSPVSVPTVILISFKKYNLLRFCDSGAIPSFNTTISINSESSGNEYWSISAGSSSAREIVIDMARDKYPDLFDWLLFHQEWL